jgi:Rod binding domain-containing protein
MADLNGVKAQGGRAAGISMEEYRRQEQALETACKQFEGTMFSKLWKDMMKTARNPLGEDKKREYGPLEDTVVEMVSEHLSENQGVGVWKVLYDQLHDRLPMPEELRAEKAEALAASAEAKAKLNLRPTNRKVQGDHGEI